MLGLVLDSAFKDDYFVQLCSFPKPDGNTELSFMIQTYIYYCYTVSRFDIVFEKSEDSIAQNSDIWYDVFL